MFVLLDKCIVVKEGLAHLFGHATTNFPGGWGKVAPKGKATGNIEDVRYNEAKGSCYIRVMFELTKTGLDIARVYHNILGRI
jgi:hypothetical protein